MSKRLFADKIAPLGFGLCIGLGLIVAIANITPKNDPAANAKAIQDADAAYLKNDYATALTLLRPLAEKGIAKAQHGLALHYEYGLGVEKDYAEALKWDRLAATQGYAKAQSDLGHIFLNGLGVPPDEKQALIWYRQSAGQGDADGQLQVGIMYELGRGAAANHAEAITWFRKAAEQGNADAQYFLGVNYVTGNGSPIDYNEAIKWFRRAAQNGDDKMKAKVTETISNIERASANNTSDNEATRQWLSSLRMVQYKMLTKILSMMNCGQPIGTRYNVQDFAHDARFQNASWYQSVELAWTISMAQCGAANTPPETELFDQQSNLPTIQSNGPKMLLDMGGGLFHELP